MNASFSDVGYILRVSDSGEADKYLTILSQSRGMIHCVARGARRPTSRKSSHLDLLNQVRFQIGKSENPQYLNQAEAQVFYPHIKSDYHLVRLSMTVLEILLNTLPANVEDEEMYLSLHNFLTGLEKTTDYSSAEHLSQQFGLYILRHLGYPPPRSADINNLSAYFESIMNRKIISKEIR